MEDSPVRPAPGFIRSPLWNPVPKEAQEELTKQLAEIAKRIYR